MEAVQLKEQKQTAQKSQPNKYLSIRQTWSENAFEKSCEAGAGETELHGAADAEGPLWETVWA